ncbi:MAG: Gfo/Idh/MocA family oxidoreductase [Pseudomonadota bacterium]
MNSSPLRIAVFGAGLIGRRHVELIAAHPGCVVGAVADIASTNKTIADAVRAPFYADYDRLLSDETLDGAIIATPNHTHAQIAEGCLGRGLPVLIEKPITEGSGENPKVPASGETCLNIFGAKAPPVCRAALKNSKIAQRTSLCGQTE